MMLEHKLKVAKRNNPNNKRQKTNHHTLNSNKCNNNNNNRPTQNHQQPRLSFKQKLSVCTNNNTSDHHGSLATNRITNTPIVEQICENESSYHQQSYSEPVTSTYSHSQPNPIFDIGTPTNLNINNFEEMQHETI